MRVLGNVPRDKGKILLYLNKLRAVLLILGVGRLIRGGAGVQLDVFMMYCLMYVVCVLYSCGGATLCVCYRCVVAVI